MSSFGAHIRDPKQIEDARNKAWDLYARILKEMRVSSLQKLPEAFKNLDLCLTHAVYLDAIAEYIHNEGKSRGSFLVLDKAGQKPCEKMGEEWRFSLNEEGSFVEKKILEVRLDEKKEITKNWVDIRPIPREESWFENIWKDYLADDFF